VNLLEPRAPREEVQCQGMITWMQEGEQKWDARNQDDKVWGAGIMNMFAKAQGLEGRDREKERQMTVRTDGGVARGLATCTYDARRATREEPAAAAANEAQTTAQSAA